MVPAIRTLLIIVLLCAGGCAGTSAKRDEPSRGPGLAALPPAEQPNHSTETNPWGKTSNNLWREGYGFGNPNPQRIRAGQEPKDF